MSEKDGQGCAHDLLRTPGVIVLGWFTRVLTGYFYISAASQCLNRERVWDLVSYPRIKPKV
jgi:hypothetical protein